MGPKEKGVIAQSVKDVVMSLVDDSLVDSEKVGTSVYFWAFPRFVSKVTSWFCLLPVITFSLYSICYISSKAVHAKKRQLEELKSRLEESNKKLKVSREKVIAVKVSRKDRKLLHTP